APATADALGRRKVPLKPDLGLAPSRDALALKNVDDVARGDDHDRVIVIPQLFVRLWREIARCDENAELAVAEARDEAGESPHPHAVCWPVALRFEREVQANGIGLGAELVVPIRVASAVAARGRQGVVARGRVHLPDRRRAGLECMWVPEV